MQRSTACANGHCRQQQQPTPPRGREPSCEPSPQRPLLVRRRLGRSDPPGAKSDFAAHSPAPHSREPPSAQPRFSASRSARIIRSRRRLSALPAGQRAHPRPGRRAAVRRPGLVRRPGRRRPRSTSADRLLIGVPPSRAGDASGRQRPTSPRSPAARPRPSPARTRRSPRRTAPASPRRTPSTARSSPRWNRSRGLRVQRGAGAGVQSMRWETSMPPVQLSAAVTVSPRARQHLQHRRCQADFLAGAVGGVDGVAQAAADLRLHGRRSGRCASSPRPTRALMRAVTSPAPQ